MMCMPHLICLRVQADLHTASSLAGVQALPDVFKRLQYSSAWDGHTHAVMTSQACSATAHRLLSRPSAWGAAAQTVLQTSLYPLSA